MVDFYRVLVPSMVVGALIMLADVYATPWFSTMWWALHPDR